MTLRIASAVIVAGALAMSAPAIWATPTAQANQQQHYAHKSDAKPLAKKATNSAGTGQLKSAVAQMRAAANQFSYARSVQQAAQAAGGNATPTGRQLLAQHQAVYSQAQGMYYSSMNAWSAANAAHQARAGALAAAGKQPVPSRNWRKAIAEFRAAWTQARSQSGIEP